MYHDFADYYSRVFPLNPALPFFLEEELRGRTSVIDLGCGTGELGHHLIGRGFQYLGIDTDPAMIRKAAENGHESAFTGADIRNLKIISQKFSLAVSTGNVMSHLSPEELNQALNSIHSLLEPGGTWIYQIINWDMHLNTGIRFPVLMRENGNLRFHREYSGGREKISFHTRLEAGEKELFRGTETLFPMEIETHISRNKSAGFRHIHTFSGWDRKAFDSSRDISAVFVFAT